MQSLTPACTHAGLGSSGFARRYFRNRCFFLFLRLLRCFSSPGSLPYVMDWRMDDWSLSSRVSPFRYLRIIGYLLLPEAFRSLSRLSSALSAKASTLRSSSLDLVAIHFASVQSLQAVTSLTLRDCSFSAKMGFLRIMTTRIVLTVRHSPCSFLRVDNGSYIALYSIICFLKLNSF